MASQKVVVCIVLLLLATASADYCPISVDPIDFTLNDQFCGQPWFVAFLRKDSQSQMWDNICHTYFPLPDDPDTFQIYASVVYCDGSNIVWSFVAHQREPGVQRAANVLRTFDDTTFTYPGCDTYLIYRTNIFGQDRESEGGPYDIYGLSTQCRSLPLSCLSKVEEEIEGAGFPEQDYYILPMKLPHRCVTQQLCILPPNPFHKELPLVAGPGPIDLVPGPGVLGPGPGLGVFGPDLIQGPGILPGPAPFGVHELYPGPNTGYTSGPKLVSATGPRLVSASGPTVSLI